MVIGLALIGGSCRAYCSAPSPAETGSCFFATRAAADSNSAGDVDRSAAGPLNAGSVPAVCAPLAADIWNTASETELSLFDAASHATMQVVHAPPPVPVGRQALPAPGPAL